MTDSKPTYFGDPSNMQALQRLVLLLPLVANLPKELSGLTGMLEQIVKTMIANPNEFDRDCQVNIGWIGPAFMGDVRKFASPSSKETFVASRHSKRAAVQR